MNEFNEKKGLLHQLTIGPFDFFIKRLNRRYQVRYKFNKKHLVADIVLFLAVLLLIGFNFYIAFGFNKLIFSLNIKVATEVSADVRSGGQTTYVVTYTNNNQRVNLSGVALTIDLPPALTITDVSDSRFDQSSGILTIGDLPAKSEGQLIIRGVTWGDAGSQQRVVSRLRYDVTDPVSWSDQVLSVADYPIVGSVLTTALDVPSVVVNKTAFPVGWLVANNSSYNFDNVSIDIAGSDGLTMAGGDVGTAHALSLQPDQSPIASQSTAKFTGTNQDTITTTAVIHGTVNGQRYLLDKLEVVSDVVYPQFAVTMTADPATPSLGDTITYHLDYRNGEEQAVENLVVGVHLDQRIWDIHRLTADQPVTIDNTQRTATWTIPTSLDAGASGQLSFTVPTTTGSESSLAITPFATYTMIYHDQPFSITADFDPINQRLSSTVTVSAFARYFTMEGEQLGIGPLPPVVSVPTTYRVYLTVDNTINAVDNTVITATLPSNVTWQGKASVSYGPTVTYDATNRQVHWPLGRLEAFAGQQTSPVVASFEVSLTPSSSQLNQYPPLLSSITITATDAVTGKLLGSSAAAVTTNLTADKRAAAKGGKVSSF